MLFRSVSQSRYGLILVVLTLFGLIWCGCCACGARVFLCDRCSAERAVMKLQLRGVPLRVCITGHSSGGVFVERCAVADAAGRVHLVQMPVGSYHVEVHHTYYEFPDYHVAISASRSASSSLELVAERVRAFDGSAEKVQVGRTSDAHLLILPLSAAENMDPPDSSTSLYGMLMQPMVLLPLGILVIFKFIPFDRLEEMQKDMSNAPEVQPHLPEAKRTLTRRLATLPHAPSAANTSVAGR